MAAGERQVSGEREELIASIHLSPIATVVTDPRLPDNPIVAVNAAFCALTGYDEAEIVGRNCRFLGGEETETEPRAMLRAAIAAGRPAIVELTNYRRDGSAFRNAVMIAPLFDAAGALALFIGSQMEVAGGAGLPATRQAEALERVARLTPRQRQVLEHMIRGYRNKQIAGFLGIDEKTVKMHRACLLENLGAPTTADAIRIGVEAGLQLG